LAINTLIPIDFSSVVTIVLVLLPDVFVLLPDVFVLLPDVFVLLPDVFVPDVFVLLPDVTLDDVELVDVQGDVELQHSNPSGNELQYPSPQF